MVPPTSISERKKVQQFLFETSGILLLTGVQKLYGPDISSFLPCMLQFLDNLRKVILQSMRITFGRFDKGLFLKVHCYTIVYYIIFNCGSLAKFFLILENLF